MKKLVLLFSFLFIFTSIILDQTIIENPEKPLSKNPGRILPLEEIMRIKESKDTVLFEGEYYQMGIDIAHDGSIFVKDKLKLYRFDANGKFVKNIVKIGQGPGEIQRELTDYKVIGDDVLLFSGPVSKLVKLDLSGNLKEELKLIQRRFSRFLASYNQKYFFVDYRQTDFSRKSGMKEYERNLCIQDQEGYINVVPFSFPTKSLVSYLSGGVSIVPVTQPVVSRIAEHYIYLSHTQEYLINQIDLNSGKVSKVFRRTYPRVKCPRKRRGGSRLLVFENDVHGLLVYKKHPWVLTSTSDEEKGILVDMFNEEGIYQDSFYLQLVNAIEKAKYASFPQKYLPMTISGDYLFAIEYDEDDYFCVVKYKIPDL